MGNFNEVECTVGGGSVRSEKLEFDMQIWFIKLNEKKNLFVYEANM